MALKSIIDIDVDKDGSFAKFAARFDQYQKLLKSSPRDWAKVTQGIGRTRAEFDALVKSQISVKARTDLLAVAESRAARITMTWADHWRNIEERTKRVAGNLREATGTVLRWASLGTVFSGLLGAGSLFGIDRLAASVAAGRRGALGLGIGYGQQRAFGVNFSRLIDPGAFLSAVSQARGDITQRAGFYGAGLTERDLAGNTGQVSVALLRKLKQIADTTDPRLFAQVIAARGLGQFTSVEDLRRLRSTSPGEFQQLLRSYSGDARSLNLTQRTQKAWQDFTTQMSRAGQQIENTLVRGLLPLEPGLEKLSASFEKAVRAFLGSDTVKHWMDEAGKGLESLAKYLGDPKFEKDVGDLVDGLGKIVTAIGSFLTWFGGTTPGKVSSAAKGAAAGFAVGSPFGLSVPGAIAGGVIGYTSSKPTTFAERLDSINYIVAAAKKRGIDPAVAVQVAQSEGLNRYVGDKGTSFGPFQLHYRSNIPGFRSSGLGDAFTKATGLDARDSATTHQQIDFALDYAKTHGWSAWHGWRGSPRAGIGGQPTIRVENQTGGNTIVTTNQIAGP